MPPCRAVPCRAARQAAARREFAAIQKGTLQSGPLARPAPGQGAQEHPRAPSSVIQSCPQKRGLARVQLAGWGWGGVGGGRRRFTLSHAVRLHVLGGVRGGRHGFLRWRVRRGPVQPAHRSFLGPSLEDVQTHQSGVAADGEGSEAPCPVARLCCRDDFRRGLIATLCSFKATGFQGCSEQ
ncbi:hypothetical protein HJG60_009113 [Phyllostomus discolor]|uniref:Uncharacterized protein n=1 Tax=Phyllostomus discolor TaxID=89673 RepID=A0A834DFR8_9CHIR|nr:hypothetical protein HJG60_009113 [Phyllostomus discolor]